MFHPFRSTSAGPSTKSERQSSKPSATSRSEDCVKPAFYTILLSTRARAVLAVICLTTPPSRPAQCPYLLQPGPSLPRSKATHLGILISLLHRRPPRASSQLASGSPFHHPPQLPYNIPRTIRPKHRTPRHNNISPRLCRLIYRPQPQPAINFNIQLRVALAQRGYFRHHVRHELLAAEAGFDCHY